MVHLEVVCEPSSSSVALPLNIICQLSYTTVVNWNHVYHIEFYLDLIDELYSYITQTSLYNLSYIAVKFIDQTNFPLRRVKQN